MAKQPTVPKRKNRAVQLGDMIGNALDPALRKRGFASRDLVANWTAIAPDPYNRVSMPDRLVWPRNNKPDADGAILYLRCQAGQALAVSYDGPMIAQAINRYFGYFLVSSVKLSASPMDNPQPEAQRGPAPLAPEKSELLEKSIENVEDAGLRAALERLGQGVLANKRK